ncbi:MAG: hypothetical protein JXQ82_08500 [Methanomicrobiaceae archaeon]|nr:hypothetical protein [Methanomicrobiaceae archaeon]
MKENDLLFEEICSIQSDYKYILEKIVDKVSFDDISNAILDEISIFWSTRFEIVDLYLRNLSPSHDAYAFTGATFLDLEKLEHFSFVLLGDIHILDDQVSFYASLAATLKDSEFTPDLKKAIVNSIRSNLEILSKYGNNILILPLRSSESEYRKLIAKNMDSIFLDLFKEPPASMEEYFATYKTIDAICNGLRDESSKLIILSDTDDISKPFRERLSIAIKDESLSLENDESIGFKFWTIVGGHLGQALSVIFSCVMYNITPFLRYSVAFFYVLLLSQNFSEQAKISPIFFKFRLARAIYGNFKIEHFRNVDFDDYCSVVKESNFYLNLLSAFPVQSIESVSAKEINNVIQGRLDMFYSLFEKNTGEI